MREERYVRVSVTDKDGAAMAMAKEIAMAMAIISSVCM
jgi:hypothetical protein